MQAIFTGRTLQLSFLVATMGALGSLYFSEILKYPPCVLCWYQRICLYPLVFIFGTALWYNDSKYKRYAVPFVVVGALIAVYHNLIYYGVIAEALTPCTGGVPCSSKQLELYGFITIPVLSLVGFIALGILIGVDRVKGSVR